jgi:hypothetical protein
MKRCAHCGKDYPDDAVRCLIDGELVASGESQPLPAPLVIASTAALPSISPSLTDKPPASLGRTWTADQMRAIELALVCVVAFGGSILSSTHYFTNPKDSPVDAWAWVNSGLHEGATLGLLWYVLMRRSRTFRDLGLYWRKSDFGFSILLYVVAIAVFFLVYGLIRFSGLTSSDRSAAAAQVHHY